MRGRPCRGLFFENLACPFGHLWDGPWRSRFPLVRACRLPGSLTVFLLGGIDPVRTVEIRRGATRPGIYDVHAVSLVNCQILVSSWNCQKVNEKLTGAYR